MSEMLATVTAIAAVMSLLPVFMALVIAEDRGIAWFVKATLTIYALPVALAVLTVIAYVIEGAAS